MIQHKAVILDSSDINTMENFVRPETKVIVVAMLFILLIGFLTSSVVKEKLRLAFTPYLHNANGLAAFICALIAGFLFTLLAANIADSEIQKIR